MNTELQNVFANKNEYVIVRSRNEGINAGYVVAATKDGIKLRSVRRIWHHKPLDETQAWYEGVANSGVSEDSKLSPAVSTKTIIEAYSTTCCSDAARESIEGKQSHGTN